MPSRWIGTSSVVVLFDALQIIYILESKYYVKPGVLKYTRITYYDIHLFECRQYVGWLIGYLDIRYGDFDMNDVTSSLVERIVGVIDRF